MLPDTQEQKSYIGITRVLPDTQGQKWKTKQKKKLHWIDLSFTNGAEILDIHVWMTFMFG